MHLLVERIDHEDESIRNRLFDFLAPHEPYCLFITGNLKKNQPDSHLYIVRSGTEWLGVAGYYSFFRSLTSFSLEPEAVRALTRHVVEVHPDILHLTAIAHVAEPACDELRRMGYQIVGDPRCVFMRLETLPAFQPHEDLARLIVPSDYADVVLLHRYLRLEPSDAPATEEELRAVGMNSLCQVLELKGSIVSTALTNGMGISAFQILGVATKLEHRNKGYARAVCASLIREMWKAGARQSILFTQLDNFAAQACYKKLGFRIDGEYWVAKLSKIVAND